jgi:hypothetical protein
MTTRPWRLEYMNAEGVWVSDSHRTYHTKRAAETAKAEREADQPGVIFRVEKHVEFEAGY